MGAARQGVLRSAVNCWLQSTQSTHGAWGPQEERGLHTTLARLPPPPQCYSPAWESSQPNVKLAIQASPAGGQLVCTHAGRPACC